MARTQTFENGDLREDIRKMLNAFTDWNVTYSYNIGDGCLYNDSWWISLVDTNVGVTPVVGDNWKLLPYSLEDLDNVVVTTPVVGDSLYWNGISWINTSAPGISYGENMLLNPGFETPGTTYVFNTWHNFTGTTADITTFHTGTTSCKLEYNGTATPPSWYFNQIYQTVTVQEGENYQLSFYVFGDGFNPGKYAIQDVVTGLYLAGTANGKSVVTSSASWSKVSVFFIPPVGCTSIRIFLVPANVIGAVSYFDDISLQLAITHTIAETQVKVSDSILANGAFEILGTGAIHCVFDTWYDTYGVTASTTTVNDGSTTSCKIVKSDIVAQPTWYYNQIKQTFTVLEGKKYQLSFWVYGDGIIPGRYAIQNVSAAVHVWLAGTGVGTAVANANASWQKVSVLFDTTGCTSITIYLVPGMVTGAVSYFDDVSVQLVTPVTADSVISAQRVILPNRFTAVVGDELQLFTRGMIEAQDPYRSPWEFVCTKGKDYRRYFSYTPVAGDVAGSPYDLLINVLDEQGNVISKDNCFIDVVNHTAQPAAAKKILCMGDSFTENEAWSQEFYRRLADTVGTGTPAANGYGNIDFIGEQKMTDFATQGYFGWGGWTAGYYTGTGLATNGHKITVIGHGKTSADLGKSYTIVVSGATVTCKLISIIDADTLKIFSLPVAATIPSSGTLVLSGQNIVYTAQVTEPASPLWNGTTFSFKDYITVQSLGTIDVLYIELGWNVMGTAIRPTAADWDNSPTMIDLITLLNKFHTSGEYPNAKVKLMGLQVPSINGGLGYTYGSTGLYSNYYKLLRNINGLNLAYQNLANVNSGWMEFIGISQQFDSENNMQSAATAVNKRSATTELLGNNGLHPATEGYYQIADAAYRNFIKNYCS